MPATKTQLIGGAFQDSKGNVLANGYLLMKLNQDNSVSGVGNIAAGVEIKIILNSSGSVDTSTPQYVWATDVMAVANAFYRITGYTAAGQPAWGPNNQQVTSGGVGGGTFDTGLWVPNVVFSWTPPQQALLLETNGTKNVSQIELNLESTDSTVTITDEGNGSVNLQASKITLQTNETPNGSQSLLDLHAGTNVTLTDNGSGRVTIAATGGLSLEVDGTPNGSQSLLNLVSGSGVTITDGGAGAVTIASSGGGAVQTATVNLSAADLAALRSTPKTLVAGQAGKTIVPICYQLIYTFVTAPYTGDTGNVFNVFPGTDITLQWDNGIRATGFVDQSSDLIAFANSSAPNNQQAFPVPQALASFQGKDLSLGFGATQGAAPLSGGSGTVTCIVSYMVF